MRQVDRFKKLAAAVAATPLGDTHAAAYAAARDVAARFGTARALLVFVFAVNSISQKTGIGRADVDELAALAGIPVGATDTILADLERAGFLALYGRGKARRVTLPFVGKSSNNRERVTASVRAPVAAATSLLQH